MKLGISSASFFLRAKTEETFDIMRELGIELCEVFLTTFSEFETDFAHIINENKGAIKVHSIHTLNTTFEPQLYNLAERTRNDGEVYFRKVLECAKIFGAKHYTFHGQSRLKQTTKMTNPNWMGNRTEELWQIAKTYGVELCFENVVWAAFNRPEFFEEIARYSENIKACLDIKQAMRSGIDWRAYLKVMGNRLQTVHISDYDENGNTCLVGDGVFDFETFFKNLRDNGYDDAVLIEQYSTDYRDIAHLKKGIEYISNIIAKL